MLRAMAILMFLLAGFAMLIDANAMKTATVFNAGSLSVSHTDYARLAVSTVSGSIPSNKGWVSTASNRVVLDFTQGGTGFGTTGTYTIRDVFQVTNNESSTAHKISVNVAYNTLFGITFQCKIPGMGINAWQTLSTCPPLLPGKTMYVGVTITPTGSGPDTDVLFTVTGQ